jgi:hypothetical protein
MHQDLLKWNAPDGTTGCRWPGRTDCPSVRNQKKLTDKTNTHRKNLGAILKELKFNRFIYGRNFHQISIKRDRWHNLMEISIVRTDGPSVRTEQKIFWNKHRHWQRQTHTQKTLVIHQIELNIDLFPSDLQTWPMVTDGNQWTDSRKEPKKADRQRQHRKP